MDVTLRQLEVFVAVADSCHFGRAAASLHVSQPVVSHEIRRLERTLGGVLFDRSTRTVALSELGLALLDHARAVTEAAAAFSTTAGQLAPLRVRHLRVAVTPSVLNEFLPAVLRRADSHLPDAVLEEVPVQTGQVASALAAGECDIGIGRFIEPPTGFTGEVVRQERVLVAISDRHPLAHAGPIDLAALGDLPLLLWPRSQHPAYHDHLLAMCAERGLDPLLLVSPPLIVGGRSYLIADGRAFCFITESTASRVTEGIAVVPLRRPAQLPLAVVWRERDPRPVVAEAVDVIRAAGAALQRRARAGHRPRPASAPR